MYQCAHKIICESCEEVFYSPIVVHTTVCTDNEGGINDSFSEGNLNTVTCTICKQKFTYELPMLIYSLKNPYAITVLPSKESNTYTSKSSAIFKILKLNINRFRLVNYQCEALEKVKIFENNLDDVTIEKIKLSEFNDSYFENKTLNILLFKEVQDNKLIFEYKDFLGNVIETHYISKEKYDSLITFRDINNTYTNKTNWLKVDTKYIKENKIKE